MDRYKAKRNRWALLRGADCPERQQVIQQLEEIIRDAAKAAGLSVPPALVPALKDPRVPVAVVCGVPLFDEDELYEEPYEGPRLHEIISERFLLQLAKIGAAYVDAEYNAFSGRGNTHTFYGPDGMSRIEYTLISPE